MSDALKVRCPRCKAVLTFPREHLFQRVQCRHCAKSFRFISRTSAPSSGQPAPSEPSVAAPSPAPSDDGAEFDFATLAANEPMRAPRTSSSAPTSRKAVVLALVVAAATATAAVAYWRLGRTETQERPDQSIAPDEPAAAGKPESAAAPPTRDVPTAPLRFPRRFLFIAAHQYVYANPIGATPNEAAMVRSVRDFAEKKLRVPNDQVYIVSDVGPEQEVIPPLKSVIESAISQFCSTSRAQDRIMIFFVGHAVERDGQPFLVPLEGEFENKQTLIPLGWVYQRLAECPARQKVLVVDVARSDSSRGFERPGGGPLGAKLDAALAQPPEGVQVWAACAANQYSHEFEAVNQRKYRVRGGAFLSLLMQGFSQGGNVQRPDDSLPVPFLEQHVRGPVAEIVKAREKGAIQTPRLAGSESNKGAAYDPKAPPPPRFEIKRPAADGAASVAEIQALIEEIAVPALRLPRDAAKSESSPARQAAALAVAFPFSAEAMRPYAADYKNLRAILDKPKDYPLRMAVLGAVEALDRQGRLNRIRVGDKEVAADRLIETVRNLGNDDAVKKSLTKSQQEGPALMLVELQDALEQLEKAGKGRSREPSRRWQAHYDYVLAQLKMRMAFVHEYNTVIAKVKRDELPKLDGQLHNGWRLAAQEKIQSSKDVRDLASDARKLLAKLIEEHPNTPWEVLAKRARSTALGLAWQPTNLRVE